MQYLMFIFISAIWGSSFILMKKAGLNYPPFSLCAGRILLAAALLYVAIKCLKGIKYKINKKDFWGLTFVAVCTALAFIFQPYLINKYGSGFIGIMVIFVPLITIIVSIPMLKIKPTFLELVGVVGGIGFMFMLLQDGLERDITFIDFCLAVATPILYAVSNTYTKKSISHIPAIHISFWIMFISGLMVLPFALAFEKVKVDDFFFEATLSLSALAFLGTGLAAVCFFFLIEKRGPLFAGMVTYLIPLGAIVWGYFDDEVVTDMQLIAIVGLILMVALVQWQTGKESKIGSVSEENEDGNIIDGVRPGGDAEAS